MGTLDVLLQSGAAINAIHRGEGIQTVNRNSFHDFVIPEVDPSKCITLHKVGHLFANQRQQLLDRATLLVNSPTTVRLQSVNTFDPIPWVYQFEVVEYAAGVNVQRGIDSFTPTANGGVVNLPIASVDLNKSKLFYRIFSTNNGFFRYFVYEYTAQLINATTIQIRNRSPSSDACQIQWEILTYD